MNNLSYKIIGLCYDMYNQLGYGHREKVYQKALEELLIANKIKFNKELYCPIVFNHKNIGKYYLDFLVENQIIVELKVAHDFYQKYFLQVINYLKAKNLKLGLIILITKDGIRIKRVIN